MKCNVNNLFDKSRKVATAHHKSTRLMNASDPLQKSKCCAKNSKLTLGEMSRQGAMAGRGGGGGPVILSVAEKPSVARELAAIIGGGSANRVRICVGVMTRKQIIYFHPRLTAL
jgi:hypothetical protein